LINSSGKIKLLDFGASSKVEPLKGIIGLEGTALYCAPEVAN
jgi:serine/threonine protein kinase